MGTVLTTVLIAAPLAFLAGWLLGKALFTHLSITRPNPAPAQPQAREQAQTQKLPPMPESAALQQLQKQLQISQADSQAALNEAAMLKDAVAEREHQLAGLRQQLEVAQHEAAPEHDPASIAAIQTVQQAKAMRALQQQSDANEHELAQVRRELVQTTHRLEGFRTRSRNWRTRLKPLKQQFRQQRVIISELREELRQRELQREQEVQRQKLLSAAAANPAPTAPPEVIRTDTPTSPADLEQKLRVEPAQSPAVEQADDLEQLRGVGPALHKKLNEKGVYRLQQLADMTSDELTRLGRSVGVSMKLIRKHDWSAQARRKLAHAGPAAVSA